MRNFAACLWLLSGTGLLSACTEISTASHPETGETQAELTAPAKPSGQTFERTEATTFNDVLMEYQAANERLARVAAPLRLKNAGLCPQTWRDPGFSIHRLEDYPIALQNVAETMLGIKSDGIYVRAVRPESSAAKARISPGDQILAVNENAINPKPLMESYNRAVFRNGFESVLSKIKIRTPESREFVARIRPETVCDIPSKLIFSEDVNGHTDGQQVFITSALIRDVPDDTNLALVIAHEMAHVIADHMKRPPSQDLELEADRMALVLMARAGYDINSAVAYWKSAAHPHDGGHVSESSHPSTRARYQNFKKELDRIRKIGVIEDLEF